MQVIAIANQKGGTGKTTTVAALAQAAAHEGLRVLAVDIDPQGNLSILLAADPARPGSFDLLQGRPAAETIQTTGDRIDVIPASWNLQTVTSGTASAHRLRNALQPILPGYDLVFIDTPPTAGELQYNALMAADAVVIPLQADVVSLRGLSMMKATVDAIQKANRDLTVAGYILTRYDARTTLSRQLADAIRARAQELDIPYLTTIREAVAIREAQTLQRDLYEYAPRSKPAADYMNLLHILID